jgi:hypothetical protein
MKNLYFIPEVEKFLTEKQVHHFKKHIFGPMPIFHVFNTKTMNTKSGEPLWLCGKVMKMRK